MLLTAKVEVDAGGDLSILVLGFHFVKSSVRLDDIIELQNHRVLVPPVLVDADPRPGVLHNRHVLTEPHHLRLRTASESWGLVQVFFSQIMFASTNSGSGLGLSQLQDVLESFLKN